MGRRPSEEIAGKPIGSVHGDSIGVHATDSANAWRNMARASNTRNCFASLILGAYQVSLDRTQMSVEDNVVDLTPGMAVTVEISTGSRTVLSYLLSPLSKYAHDSLRER